MFAKEKNGGGELQVLLIVNVGFPEQTLQFMKVNEENDGTFLKALLKVYILIDGSR